MNEWSERKRMKEENARKRKAKCDEGKGKSEKESGAAGGKSDCIELR